MRNIVSTNTAIDVDVLTSERIKAVIDDTAPELETYTTDSIGQRDYQIRLVCYVDPGTGDTRWAVAYEDPASVEYEDFDSRQEADGRYAEMVRDCISGSDAGHG